jgi:hypothetical protein
MHRRTGMISSDVEKKRVSCLPHKLLVVGHLMRRLLSISLSFTCAAITYQVCMNQWVEEGTLRRTPVAKRIRAVQHFV